MSALIYWIWLSSLEGLTPLEKTRLVRQTGSAKALFSAPLAYLGLNEKKRNYLETHRQLDQAEALLDYAGEHGISCVCPEDAAYPESIRELADAPPVLYVKGRLPREDEMIIAVVGARKCTPYGYQTAAMFSRSLAVSGVGIISGMARGIDSSALWGAAEAGGAAFAVLGCGVDICYPRDNMELYAQMPEAGGIISEFPPGTQPLAWHFPMRNRLISALSRGVLVIEGRRRSGSLITARQGLDQGRNIYAVPGRIDDPLSEGCNLLIQEGARLVMKPEDLLEDYGLQIRVSKKNDFVLAKFEKVVYASLCLIPRTPDEVADLCRLPIRKVLPALTTLELKGAAVRLGKNQYILKV